MMDRRGFVLTGAALAVAGCTGGDGGGDGAGEDGGGESQAGDGGAGGGAGATATGHFGGHAATTGLDSQPTLGPRPRDATGVIVAFEDPSCPRCRAFERDVVPEIRSQLVKTGTAALVVRGYPVVYDWGEPAVRALEATFAADRDAFWKLWNHYFDEQAAYSDAGTEAVYPRTRSFLETAENVSVDAEGIVEAAQAGEYDVAVQTDLDAGMDAGAGISTPTLFLYRDGEYLTKISGSVSYTLIEETLQL